MHRRRRALTLVAPAVAFAVAPVAGAAELMNQTFDNPTNAPNYQYAYAYAGGGNPATDRGSLTSSRAFFDPAGSEGSQALVLQGDFTNLGTVTPMPDYNYSGFGGGFGTFFYDFGTSTVRGLPSPVLSDYSGTVDLQVMGTSGTGTGAEIQVQLQVPDDFFVPDADTNFTPFANINIPVRVTTDLQTFEFFLDQVPIQWDANVPEVERDFERHYRNIGLINMNFNVDAGAPFGNDDNNYLIIDNVTMVPEPGSAALLLGGLGLALSRRRRMPRA
jgi:hypothetical protein